MVGHSEPLVTCQRSFPIRQINVIAVETPVLTSVRPKKIRVRQRAATLRTPFLGLVIPSNSSRRVQWVLLLARLLPRVSDQLRHSPLLIVARET